MWACLNSWWERYFLLLIPSLVHYCLDPTKAPEKGTPRSWDCAEPLQGVWSWEAERTLCQLCTSIWQPNWLWNKIAHVGPWSPPDWLSLLTLFRLVLCCSSPMKCFTRELWDNPSLALTMPRSAHCFIFRLTAWIRFVLLPISGSSVRFLLFPGRQLIHWVLGMAFGEMKISTGHAEAPAE